MHFCMDEIRVLIGALACVPLGNVIAFLRRKLVRG